MKSTIPLLLAVCLVIGTLGHTQEKAAVKKTITVSELAKMDVIGDLGVPLGEAVEVQAVIVSGSALRRLALEGQYLLRIESVNGATLDMPATKTFDVPAFVDAKLANDNFSLHKLKTGRKARSLDSEQIKELEKGYVGSRVKLLVYETGGFRGIPDRLPKDAPSWQDVGFGFSTYLFVLADRG